MSYWLITQRLETNQHGDQCDTLEQNYLNYFGRYISTFVAVANHATFRWEKLDYEGVLFTGGGDLPNELLGGDYLSAEENRLAATRYEFQSRLCLDALERKKKIIAICYGMYLVNGVLGGRLTWDAHGGAPSRAPRQFHQVSLPGAAELGIEMNQARVNTYHHQGIKTQDLSPSLGTLAKDDEFDLVEAACHKSAHVLCLQWHPERESPDADFNQHLIEGFLSR